MVKEGLQNLILKHLSENQTMRQVAERILSYHNQGYPIFLDYPINPTPRYGYGKPAHPRLHEIINRNREAYRVTLESLLDFMYDILQISKVEDPIHPQEPFMTNRWLPGLDAIALYSFLCLHNPKRYCEVGSGNSTKFARRAINDHGLQTKITSIDPHPRTSIDSICDTLIRQPLEDVDMTVFDALESKDILFVDNSHRTFMNSDVTTVFLDVLPRLRSGVLVEIHDIFLPYDYPPDWDERYYSEQYLLASYILAEGNKFQIILPNYFVSQDKELSSVLSPLWGNDTMCGVITHGGSFWLKML